MAEGEGGRLDEAGQRFDQVDVDQLAATAVEVAVVERHHHGGRGRLGGHAVGQEEGWERRRSVGLAGHVGEATHRLGQGAEARPVALGATTAVPADVEHHDLGMRPVHRLVVELPRLERAGPVVHDEDVAHREEPVEQLLPVGRPQVHRHALLVPAHALPEEADTVLLLAPRAQRVADAGLLDLDDLGPELPSIVATIGPAANVAASMTRMPRRGRSGAGPVRGPDGGQAPTAAGRASPRCSRNVVPL